MQEEFLKNWDMLVEDLPDGIDNVTLGKLRSMAWLFFSLGWNLSEQNVWQEQLLMEERNGIDFSKLN